MSAYLKVKIASLAAEARIIRKLERKHQRWRDVPEQYRNDEARDRANVRFDLQMHRRFIVRPEARASQLALGYICDRAYRTMEQKTHIPLGDGLLTRIAYMVRKYGEGDQKLVNEKTIRAWMQAEAAAAIAA